MCLSKCRRYAAFSLHLGKKSWYKAHIFRNDTYTSTLCAHSFRCIVEYVFCKIHVHLCICKKKGIGTHWIHLKDLFKNNLHQFDTITYTYFVILKLLKPVFHTTFVFTDFHWKVLILKDLTLKNHPGFLLDQTFPAQWCWWVKNSNQLNWQFPFISSWSSS